MSLGISSGMSSSSALCIGYMWTLFSIYILLFIASAILWGLYEDEKEKTIGQSTIFFLFGIFFGLLFWHFQTKCDWIAATMLLFIFILVIILNVTQFDAAMLSPPSYGFKIAAEKNCWVRCPPE